MVLLHLQNLEHVGMPRFDVDSERPWPLPASLIHVPAEKTTRIRQNKDKNDSEIIHLDLETSIQRSTKYSRSKNEYRMKNYRAEAAGRVYG